MFIYVKCSEKDPRYNGIFKAYYCLLLIKFQAMLTQAEGIRLSKSWGEFMERER